MLETSGVSIETIETTDPVIPLSPEIPVLRQSMHAEYI